jgi:hypothetical protein
MFGSTENIYFPAPTLTASVVQFWVPLLLLLNILPKSNPTRDLFDIYFNHKYLTRQEFNPIWTQTTEEKPKLALDFLWFTGHISALQVNGLARRPGWGTCQKNTRLTSFLFVFFE